MIFNRNDHLFDSLIFLRAPVTHCCISYFLWNFSKLLMIIHDYCMHQSIILTLFCVCLFVNLFPKFLCNVLSLLTNGDPIKLFMHEIKHKQFYFTTIDDRSEIMTWQINERKHRIHCYFKLVLSKLSLQQSWCQSSRTCDIRMPNSANSNIRIFIILWFSYVDSAHFVKMYHKKKT